ncbi:hypothetical protein HK102_014092 [Quaeritorhiza haematococci]|nr:hypothetical protein HK102_014092 [Quaeritorhiza haematococci]
MPSISLQLNTLPAEILAAIISYLDHVCDKVSLARTSRRLLQISFDPQLWTELAISGPVLNHFSKPTVNHLVDMTDLNHAAHPTNGLGYSFRSWNAGVVGSDGLNSSLRWVLRSLKKLVVRDLSDHPVALLKQCVLLESLDLSFNECLSDRGILALFTDWHEISVNWVAGEEDQEMDPDVNHDAVLGVYRRQDELSRHLTLSGGKGEKVRWHSRLQNLSLAHCERLTDVTALVISRELPQLRRLDVNG